MRDCFLKNQSLHMSIYVRVYSNGDRVVHHLEPNEVERQLSYDKVMRFGCALFVDGKCEATGYLDEERCEALSKELTRQAAKECAL